MYMRFSVLVSKVLAYNFVDLFDIKVNIFHVYCCNLQMYYNSCVFSVM